MCLVVDAQYGNGSNLKTSGRYFQVFALVSQIKLVKSDFGYFFFLSKFTSFCFLGNLKARHFDINLANL